MISYGINVNKSNATKLIAHDKKGTGFARSYFLAKKELAIVTDRRERRVLKFKLKHPRFIFLKNKSNTDKI